MSAVATVVGLVFVVLAYTANQDPGGWNSFYESVVPVGGSQDWNLLVRVLAPVVLVSGGWYLGEQIISRRKFDRLVDTKKRSEFQKNYDELEELAGKLPKRYEERLEEKADTFSSRR